MKTVSRLTIVSAAGAATLVFLLLRGIGNDDSTIQRSGNDKGQTETAGAAGVAAPGESATPEYKVYSGAERQEMESLHEQKMQQYRQANDERLRTWQQRDSVQRAPVPDGAIAYKAPRVGPPQQQ